MRPRSLLLAAPCLALSLFLAGCATNPSPVGDAEAAHSGVACPAGTFVSSFTAAGSPSCTAPSFAGVSCADGEVLTGFDSTGAPRCEGIMAVAEEAMRKDARYGAEPARPARSLALASNSALQGGVKSYTVASATPQMTWSHLKLTLDGADLRFDLDGACPRTPSAKGTFLACAGATAESADSSVDAGDTITLGGVSSGQTLRVLDRDANSVILTLVVG